MTTPIAAVQSLRFEISPLPDESQRACTAIAQAALPASRSGLLMFALYAGVGGAAYLLTPTTWPLTFLIGIVAIAATALGLQAEVRRRLRRLRLDDPHARETHFVELSPDGIRAWCSHIDARYPWSDFARTVENGDFYLFVRPSGTGTAIPKRLLDDTLEAQLRACVQQWSPDRGSGLARIVG
jgi:hypothetical protein